MQREALKFKTGPDKTKREAGKIRERADTGERRNATVFVEHKPSSLGTEV